MIPVVVLDVNEAIRDLTPLAVLIVIVCIFWKFFKFCLNYLDGNSK